MRIFQAMLKLLKEEYEEFGNAPITVMGLMLLCERADEMVEFEALKEKNKDNG